MTACRGSGDELSFGSFDINGVSTTVKGDKAADGTSLEDRWAVLLAGSYVFCWLNIRWLALVLLGTTRVTYLIGLWIQRVQDGRKAYMDAHKAEMDREQRKA